MTDRKIPNLQDIEFQALLAYLEGGKVETTYLSPDALEALDSIDKYENDFDKKPPIAFLEQLANRPAPLQRYDIDYINNQLISKMLRTELQRNANTIFQIATDDPMRALSKMQSICDEMATLVQRGSDDDMVRFSDWRKRLERLNTENPDPIYQTLCRFGLPTMDTHTQGLCRGDLAVICGQTNEGKSWLSKKVIKTNIVEDNKNLMWLPFEEDAEVAMSILDSMIASVDSISYMNGQLDAQERMRMWQMFEKIAIQGHGEAVIPKAVHKIQRGTTRDVIRLCKEFKSDMVIIDQLTLLAKSLDWQDMGTLARDLKVAATLLQIPVLLITQATRYAKPILEVGYEAVAHAEEITRNADSVIYVAPSRESVKANEKYFKLIKTRRGEKDIITTNRWDLALCTIEELQRVDPNSTEFQRPDEEEGGWTPRQSYRKNKVEDQVQAFDGWG